MEIEEVFEARMTLEFASESAAFRTLSLASISSMIASIINSASLRESIFVEG